MGATPAKAAKASGLAKRLARHLLAVGLTVTSSGARVSREDYLRQWATGFDPEVIVYWDVRDELITVFGDVALVRATNKATIRQDGAEQTGMTTYTDTYLRESGEWKVIQAQITRVAPKHYLGDETIVSVSIEGQLQKLG